MRTIYFQLNVPRVAATKALGKIHSGAFFSSISPVHSEDLGDVQLQGDRWVRVRNRLSGICGSDLHLVFVDGDPRISLAAIQRDDPLYLGHEVVGEVVEAGPATKTLAAGDRVVFQKLFATCEILEIDPPCSYCAAGAYNRCENLGTAPAPTAIGGGWSDEIVAHEAHFFPVPDDVLDADASLIEPAAVGVRAALRRPPEAGDHVLVIGCGTIGLMTLQAVRAAAPEAEITAMAKYDFQAQMARRLGADRIVAPRAGYARMAEITGARYAPGSFGSHTLIGGFDVIYDSVGGPRTLRDSLRWARAGGAVLMIGNEYAPMKVDLTPLWFQEVDVLGVGTHGTEAWEGERLSTFERVVRWLREGRLDFDGFITHRFPLDQWREAIEVATDKARYHSIKVSFEWRESKRN